MSTLTLLRHGQAAFDTAHYAELSALGLEQARACGAYFLRSGLHFDRVFSGPRQRQRLTAEAALAGLQAPAPQIVDALDEFAEGTQILRAVELRLGQPVTGHAAISRQQKLQLYGDEIRLWASGAVSIDGVASATVFRTRVRAWLDATTADSGAHQQLLAVSSGGVIAAVVAEVLGLPDTALSALMSVIGNGSISRVVWSRHGRVLESFNQTAHLPPTLLSGI